MSPGRVFLLLCSLSLLAVVLLLYGSTPSCKIHPQTRDHVRHDPSLPDSNTNSNTDSNTDSHADADYSHLPPSPAPPAIMDPELPEPAPEVLQARMVFKAQQTDACGKRFLRIGSLCRKPVSKEGVNTEAITKPGLTQSYFHQVWDHLEYTENHFFSPLLASGFVKLIKQLGGRTVGDLGCGPGIYAKFFRKSGLEAIGYDGSGGPAPPDIHLLNLFDFQGLRPDNYLPSFDVVLSVELGEHIPAQYTFNFLNTITSRARIGVVLSWGIPRQAGHGHLNLQPNRWVVEQMASRGFAHLPSESQGLWDAAEADWFKHTIMVFIRPQRTEIAMLSLIPAHHENYGRPGG